MVLVRATDGCAAALNDPRSFANSVLLVLDELSVRLNAGGGGAVRGESERVEPTLVCNGAGAGAVEATRKGGGFAIAGETSDAARCLNAMGESTTGCSETPLKMFPLTLGACVIGREVRMGLAGSLCGVGVTVGSTGFGAS